MDRSMTEEQEDRAAGGDIGIGDGDIAGTNIPDKSKPKKQSSGEKNLRDGITGGYGTGGTVGQGDENGQ